MLLNSIFRHTPIHKGLTSDDFFLFDCGDLMSTYQEFSN